MSVAQAAARAGRVGIALDCVSRALSAPRADAGSAAEVTEEVALSLRRLAVQDRGATDHFRFQSAEKLLVGGSDGAVAVMSSLAKDDGGCDAPTRVRAAVAWRKADATPEALDALVEALRAASGRRFPSALSEWSVEGCELASTSGRFDEVSGVLTALLCREDIGPDLKRRAAALLAERGIASSEAALRSLCEDVRVPTIERILGAWALAGIAPTRGRAALIDLARVEPGDGLDFDALLDRRTAARALIESGFHAEGAMAIQAMREHPAGSDDHRLRCDELWGVATLAAQRQGQEVGVR